MISRFCPVIMWGVHWDCITNTMGTCRVSESRNWGTGAQVVRFFTGAALLEVGLWEQQQSGRKVLWTLPLLSSSYLTSGQLLCSPYIYGNVPSFKKIHKKEPFTTFSSLQNKTSSISYISHSGKCFFLRSISEQNTLTHAYTLL